jgi:hypothetical protein
MEKPHNLSQPVRFERDSQGLLVLIDPQGQRHTAVEPVRAFPVSDPDRFVSICDDSGREMHAVSDLRALAPAARAVLEAELARQEFVPIMRRVLQISIESTPVEWEVETDRGHVRFMVNSGDDVRPLGENRALVIDADGIRYMIEDSTQLDRASRRLLEHYL